MSEKPSGAPPPAGVRWPGNRQSRRPDGVESRGSRSARRGHSPAIPAATSSWLRPPTAASRLPSRPSTGGTVTGWSSWRFAAPATGMRPSTCCRRRSSTCWASPWLRAAEPDDHAALSRRQAHRASAATQGPTLQWSRRGAVQTACPDPHRCGRRSGHRAGPLPDSGREVLLLRYVDGR